ncbi:uncharacterized protein SPSK_03229 [Sporothrix schenckii 1099-18]|uniref:Uncharacterized protein n=2 Tax=Sporothrix schenckii TaxID=29908 RepID=U7PPH3_SPOS1|nr:uncharacterized protein SPSK_03229 [Sporothrix schenckii 1099-18]ERS97477.1 hypothetical protein HMPREF1624_05645 [Sporothrix schenckii ATCC 58251]KJR81981.1 hypothetical protein SPSK_03229 [Sporothrix schenckii 1099-18]
MAGSPRPEFHVPGAYHFDNPLPYAIPTPRALGADVFRPPVASSPTDSTYLDLARSAGSLYSDVSSVADHGAKRKRAAQDSRESTPLAEWDANATFGQHGGRHLYTLAGQIDVQGAPGLHDAMDESVYSDVEYRRALGPHDATAAAEAAADDAQSDADRWTVLHALGNVVGKVWEFCTAGAFRGFHAGGGESYDWETGKPTEIVGESPTPQPQSEEHKDEPTLTRTPHPAHDDRDRETTPQRNGKRRQVSAAGDELGRNWVIVDPKLKQRQSQAHAQTPRRSTAQGQGQGHGLGQRIHLRGGRASTSTTPAAADTRTPDRRAPSYTRGSATTTVTPSTAASRRINTPISRIAGAATTTPHGHRGASAASVARVSHTGSPSWSSREPASFASFASPRASTPAGGAKTVSPRRPYAASYNSPGGSRIPLPQPNGADASYNNPFSRAAVAASPRPTSRAGGRSSSMVFGAAGSPAQNGHGPGHGHGHAHRRSHSGRVGVSPLLPKQTSAAGPASLDADTSLGLTESPRLNDEAKRLAAQNLAAEQESDAKMEAFNARLQQMIRQGQEALGTTFEVDGDDDDGGGRGVDDYWADD